MTVNDLAFRERLDRDQFWLGVAHLASFRGTCARRRVGCVLVDVNNDSTIGYNGTAKGEPHCSKQCPCPGAQFASGQGLELCEAIHAEQNALTRCKNPHQLTTLYCTDSPCLHCVKMLLNTPIQRIVFMRAYPHQGSKSLWERRGRVWEQMALDQVKIEVVL